MSRLGDWIYDIFSGGELSRQREARHQEELRRRQHEAEELRRREANEAHKAAAEALVRSRTPLKANHAKPLRQEFLDNYSTFQSTLSSARDDCGRHGNSQSSGCDHSNNHSHNSCSGHHSCGSRGSSNSCSGGSSCGGGGGGGGD